MFKVAPYSFTIARVLRTKVQVICASSKGNISVFRYFIMSTRTQKAKLKVNITLAHSTQNMITLWSHLKPAMKKASM